MKSVLLLVGIANLALLCRGASEDDISYLLFTRQNQETPVRLMRSDPPGLKSSNFRATKDTKILIHGWKDGMHSRYTWFKSLKKVFLEKEDVNIIVVNWEKLASGKLKASAINTRFVGKTTAAFIEFLETTTGASRKQMHIIGHSLGGQTSGFVGMNLTPRPARITGLDTADANIGFDIKNPNDCLDPTDADYVEEIHGQVSYSPKGHADFYPNGGKDNHLIVPEYFVASVREGKCAYKCYDCSSYEQFTNGCRTSDGNQMGYYSFKPSGRKQYYLNAKVINPCS